MKIIVHTWSFFLNNERLIYHCFLVSPRPFEVDLGYSIAAETQSICALRARPCCAMGPDLNVSPSPVLIFKMCLESLPFNYSFGHPGTKICFTSVMLYWLLVTLNMEGKTGAPCRPCYRFRAHRELSSNFDCFIFPLFPLFLFDICIIPGISTPSKSHCHRW